MKEAIAISAMTSPAPNRRRASRAPSFAWASARSSAIWAAREAISRSRSP